MAHINPRAIDLIEAAYDLDKLDSDWLADLVEAHGSLLEFIALLSDTKRLTPKERERWRMLGAHIATACRLRRGLGEAGPGPTAGDERLPYDAEFMLDSDGVRILDAVGGV